MRRYGAAAVFSIALMMRAVSSIDGTYGSSFGRAAIGIRPISPTGFRWMLI
jgi:hypothetical protein